MSAPIAPPPVTRLRRAAGTGAPALLAVAHGSRDPRSPQTMERLMGRVRTELAARSRPGAPVPETALSFLELNDPSVPAAIDALVARGHREVVAVPLLLGEAYHARTDLPGLLTAARDRHPGVRIGQAGVLGTGPDLGRVLTDRLAETGLDPHDRHLGVLLTSVGSSHADAERATAAMARRWHAGSGRAGIEVVTATGDQGQVSAAHARLRAAGARKIALVPWFLAPGLLLDRVIGRVGALDPQVRIAAPLGPDPVLAALVADRYAAAITARAVVA